MEDAAPHAEDEQLLGGCQCGRLRYRVVGKPRGVNCCHCRECQRLSGSAFAVNAIYLSRQVEYLGAEWGERDLMTGLNGSRSWRCRGCKVLLFAEHPAFGKVVRFVRVGTLDTGESLATDTHYFVRSKHHWVVIPDGIPAWETLPPRQGA